MYSSERKPEIKWNIKDTNPPLGFRYPSVSCQLPIAFSQGNGLAPSVQYFGTNELNRCGENFLVYRFALAMQWDKS